MSVVSAFGGGATNFNVNGANIGRISGVNADGSSPHRTSTFISHQRFYRNSNQGNTLLYESVASDGDDDGEKIDVLKSQQAKMKSKIANDRVEYPAHILDPFPQAADPSYATTGPVGQNSFVVSRMGGPTAEELTNENILLIVERRSNVTDLEVNTLVWKCLGYRFHTSSSGSGGEWRPDEVFPNWKERFPEPPDLIGTFLIVLTDPLDAIGMYFMGRRVCSTSHKNSATNRIWGTASITQQSMRPNVLSNCHFPTRHATDLQQGSRLSKPQEQPAPCAECT
jgi:hypothetical protein